MKKWWGKNQGLAIELKIYPLRAKVYFKKDYWGRIDYCDNLFCLKDKFFNDNFCIKHHKGEFKIHEKTRTIWSNRAASERDKYAKYILQPFLQDGTVNPKYMKVYGDPRKDPKMRNHPRNIYHKNWKENMEVNKMLEKFEARKLR